MSAQEVKPATAAEAKPKEEKQSNCPSCNKPIRRLKRYYRNGIFYCNKKCWKASKAPKEEKT